MPEPLSRTQSSGRIPTPVARDCKGVSTRNHSLVNEVMMRRTGIERLRLSPHFVEWMMGLPTGWTEIGPSESTHSETRLYPKQRRKRGASYGGG
jgi:hypothetical protein